jgi:serine/threonine protein kinase
MSQMSNLGPSDDDLLIDLLVDWEERVARGEVVSPDDLCHDRPELLPALTERIARLNRVRRFANPEPPEFAIGGPQATDQPLAGRYRLEKIIGEGGFGVVWQAYDLELERPVAVKVPRPDRLRLSPGGDDAFLAEARRVAKLAYPGIVTVFDVNRHHGMTFIVSELIDGDDLGRRLRAGLMTVREAVRVVADVARYLHSAHKKGLTHRDVKPANILIGRDGRVFITDFGIAASADATGALRGDTGTFSYMAPERKVGDSGLDPRSDVYSLGVVLYELVTGQLPFLTDPASYPLLASSTPRPMSPAVPTEIRQICLQCLAHDPTDRPSAGALSDWLTMWLNDSANGIDSNMFRGAWRWLKGWSRRGRRPYVDDQTVHARTEPTNQEEFEGDSIVGFYARRARTRYILQEYDKAIIDLREALRHAPDTHPTVPSVFHSLADCYFCKGEWGTAIEYYSECIGRAPTNLYARRWRAIAYKQKGDTEKALAELADLVRIAPDDAESYLTIGNVHCSLGNYGAAIEAYTQAIRLAPNDPRAYSMRGEAYTRAGRHELAIKDHDRAIELALQKSPPRPSPNGQGPEGS